MEMFSACNGPCILCRSFDGCLAGHGDSDYRPASEPDLRKRMERLRAELLRAYRYEAGEVIEVPTPADVATLKRNIAAIEEVID
jgi:ribosomal protein L29